MLKDAIDIFTGIRDIVSDDDGLEKLIAKHTGRKSNYIRSIANKSNDLICVFPVMSSRNIAIGNQAMVSKAIEKNLVAMLQMLFSAFQVADADDAFEYIKTFHTNINKSAKSFDIDDVITVSNLIDGMTESAFKVGAKVDMGIVEAVKQDLKRMNFVLESNISTRPISESFSCNIDPSGKYVVEVKPYREDNSSSVNVFNMGASSPVEPAVIKDRERIKFNYDLDKIDSQINKDKVDFFKNQVLPTEYKKANELQPTLMVINFKIKSGDRFIPVDSMVIGVKAKLYPIGSEDIITHLVAKTKDANWIQKFIKASTKEISFFKDFLFAIDKAKVDALSMSRKGSSNMMWKVLERRANKSKFNKLMARSNDSTAITTIMVSQNEVDYMKKEYQVDISDIHTARTLLDQYNLIGLCIVDESLEIAKFLYDTGDDMWETISFSNLERESNDNTYKKVVNLMTKVM